MLLGKAQKSGNNFFICHSTTQADYVFYKQNLLESITKKTVSLRVFPIKGREFYRIEPKLIPLTRVLLKKLYPRGTKLITRQFLNLLTLSGIAIWFLDAGGKSWRRKDGKIHALEITLNTGNLSKEQNEVMIAYFLEVWGFKWGLGKSKSGYCLRMGTKEGKRFLSFITPYVPDPMLDKLETSLNITATT